MPLTTAPRCRFGQHERRLVYLVGLLTDIYGTGFTDLPLDGQMRALAAVMDADDDRHHHRRTPEQTVRAFGLELLRKVAADPNDGD